MTVLDAQQRVSKIHVVVSSVTSGKLKFEGLEHVRSGMSFVFIHLSYAPSGVLISVMMVSG